MDKDDKAKRPKFSAPKAPANPDAVVTNQDEHPVTDTVVLDEAAASPLGSNPKVVSRSGSQPDSSFDDILTDTTSVKIPPKAPTAKSTKNGTSCNAVLVGIATFSLIIGLAGWALYFASSSQINIFSKPDSETADQANQTPAPTPSPAAADKSAITLEVFNGSGVSGLAGKSATTLEGLGYTIFSTGNADASDYATTEIYTNPDFTDTTVFLADLEAEFGSASISGTLEDSTASARLIVGEDWSE
ncbi:hypothetical protein A2W24_06535 [Microgenomates group bacterium RBG_16_45_19]|nr:MAG: hypothetical protein A2W24_06535 [Microgenomates group bacterium RBG_16_45_19]